MRESLKRRWRKFAKLLSSPWEAEQAGCGVMEFILKLFWLAMGIGTILIVRWVLGAL